ncbi:MAG: hypothetical protein IKY44_00720 [Clostridia bacterium]|nr:hypothetical protein [Clostridia bacterium]
MLAVSAIVAAISMILFVIGENVAGAIALAVAFGFIFSGINELSKERNAYQVVTDPTKNNIFFGNPMVDDILHIIETTGCCENISFEPETALCCKRRRFGMDDNETVYYDFAFGERKITLTLEEQYDLLNMLKHRLPNGKSYQIQVAYDRNEYEELQRTARVERFYANGMKNPDYTNEPLPARPKYYVMTTDAYRGMRFNRDTRRWERPITVYSHDRNEKAV